MPPSRLIRAKLIRTKLVRTLREQKGAGIVLVALTMVTLLSAVALAVDVGMLVTARTESQLVGDAAAMAGAGALRDSNGDSLTAHAAAVTFAGNNTVRDETVPILDDDVDVILDEWTVRVRVQRTQERGNAVPTYFARIFGIDEVDISTSSAAWAAPATTAGGDSEAACGLPLALIDKFDDANGNGVYEPHLGETHQGYDETDHGKLIKLKLREDEESDDSPPFCQTDDDPGSEVAYNIDYCSSAESNWKCWWRPDHPSEGGGGGVDSIGPLIYPGDGCSEEVSIGDIIWAASGDGNKQSLVNGENPPGHTFVDLINADPDKEWCPDCASGDRGCVVETGSTSCFDGSSIRNRSVPVVDPESISGSGAELTAEVSNHIGLFVEQVSCAYDAGPFNSNYDTGEQSGKWNVYVRLTVEAGTGSTGAGGESEASLLRNIQLIE